MEDKMRKIILTGAILLAVCSASVATAQSFNYEGQEMTKMVQSPCSGKSGRLGFSMEGIQFSLQALGVPTEVVCADSGYTDDQLAKRQILLMMTVARLQRVEVLERSDYCRTMRRGFGSCLWESAWTADVERSVIREVQTKIGS